MGVEVEAKLIARDAGPLDALAQMRALGPADLGPPTPVDELDIYLDTDDRRLGAARWACRLRSRGDAYRVSLKGPAESDAEGGIHRRPEVEAPATASFDPMTWPSSDARDLAVELSGGAPLGEWLRLRQRRTEREVRLGERRLGSLSLDVVWIEGVGRELPDPLHLVELELADGRDATAGEALVRLADLLAGLPGLAPDPRTKLEHALELLA